ncbi:hypothetical protein ACFFQF_01060 [Haladaptatus pallidirubidus]|uniref:C2H2-type domain-containing protein n=1 Tax=Haladaptatus pallidirubidus TaxID=1008152 RepID=A0AAV3UBP0_9EURY|nr:hypothetical protein [Haladaptatus pallidirubidus]
MTVEQTKHVCDECGYSFRTLSALRLHDCVERRNVIETDGLTSSEIAERVVDHVSTCERCGHLHRGSFTRENNLTDGDTFTLRFACERCEYANENTAVLDREER